MTYLSWAAFYEGPTDEAYFGQLIPRVMDELVRTKGTRHAEVPTEPAIRLERGSVADVARKACAAREDFAIAFFHADIGGRGLEKGLDHRSVSYCEAMNAECDWPPVRCVTITPRHETEAWVLADPEAVTEALGYRGSPDAIGLPANAAAAERLTDPKQVLSEAMKAVRGRRRVADPADIMAAVAQRQRLDRLRQTKSFAAFEDRLTAALADLGVCQSGKDPGR